MAGKEGSRGGHVIGHTKSGKPIHASAAHTGAGSANYTHADHKDAAAAHKAVGQHQLALYHKVRSGESRPGSGQGSFGFGSNRLG